jgi:hypothetical protein
VVGYRFAAEPRAPDAPPAALVPDAERAAAPDFAAS